MVRVTRTRARERGRKDVVKVELARVRIPRQPVVKLDVLAEGEGQVDGAVAVGRRRPLCREGGEDGAVRPVRDEALKDPVLREDFVWAVRVGAQEADVDE